MNTKVTEVNECNFPRRFAEGHCADIMVSNPRGNHYLFCRLSNGQTQFVYGGHSKHSAPSRAVIAAAEAA